MNQAASNIVAFSFLIKKEKDDHIHEKISFH